MIEIDDSQFHDWIRGLSIPMNVENSVYVLKYKGDFVGCGVSDGKKIINYVPKERRIRN